MSAPTTPSHVPDARGGLRPSLVRRIVRGIVPLAGGAAFALWAAGFLVVANAAKVAPPSKRGAQSVVFDAPKAKPPPRKKTSRKKPRAGKTTRPRNALAPQALGGALAGVNFSAPASDVERDASSDEETLLGDTDALALTADTVDAVPRVLRGQAPPYPPSLKRKGVTGRVVVAVRLDAQGAVTQHRLVSAEPAGVFDALAMQAVTTYRFTPPTKNGQPVACWVEVPFEWTLQP